MTSRASGTEALRCRREFASQMTIRTGIENALITGPALSITSIDIPTT
jgi:hypothetical protein